MELFTADDADTVAERFEPDSSHYEETRSKRRRTRSMKNLRIASVGSYRAGCGECRLGRPADASGGGKPGRLPRRLVLGQREAKLPPARPAEGSAQRMPYRRRHAFQRHDLRQLGLANHFKELAMHIATVVLSVLLAVEFAFTGHHQDPRHRHRARQRRASRHQLAAQPP